MTNLTSAQHVLDNLYTHCVNHVIHFHSVQHIHHVKPCPSCPTYPPCFMSTASYLQPCIWQVMHFAWKGFLSAAITFDKYMDYNDLWRCWWHTGENMLHGIYNMIYINTDYDRKLIKKHLFHGIDGAVTRWAFGRGAPRHCGSPTTLCKIDR